ncbi:MAG TPA: hypothetical protein VGA48_06405 [Thermoplasmata archaeon]
MAELTLARSVFWVALAAMFHGLAVTTYCGQTQVRQALLSSVP